MELLRVLLLQLAAQPVARENAWKAWWVEGELGHEPDRGAGRTTTTTTTTRRRRRQRLGEDDVDEGDTSNDDDDDDVKDDDHE